MLKPLRYGDSHDANRLLRQLSLVHRAGELRKQRRILPVWIEGDRIYMSTSETNPWDPKVKLNWEEFERVIVAAEALVIPRKEAGVETGDGLGDQRRMA